MVYMSNTPTGPYVWTLSPQTMLLFGKVVKPHGNRTYLEVGCWGLGLEDWRTSPISTEFFASQTTEKAWPAPQGFPRLTCLLHMSTCLPSYDGLYLYPWTRKCKFFLSCFFCQALYHSGEKSHRCPFSTCPEMTGICSKEEYPWDQKIHRNQHGFSNGWRSLKSKHSGHLKN